MFGLRTAKKLGRDSHDDAAADKDLSRLDCS
jgi:hypothetical protein